MTDIILDLLDRYLYEWLQQRYVNMHNLSSVTTKSEHTIDDFKETYQSSKKEDFVQIRLVDYKILSKEPIGNDYLVAVFVNCKYELINTFEGIEQKKLYSKKEKITLIKESGIRKPDIDGQWGVVTKSHFPYSLHGEKK